jgi:hypothetical protein
MPLPRPNLTGARQLAPARSVARLLVVVVPLAAGLLGCGTSSPSTGSPGTGAVSPTSTTTPTGTTPTGGAETTGPLVESWQLLGVQQDGRVIALSYVGGGGCVVFERLEVEQTATFVRISPIVRRETRPGRACPPLLQSVRTTVKLAVPLGSRPLLHAPVTAYPDSAPTR